MRRGVFSLLIVIAPAIALLSAAGCDDKIESVQRTESVQESEPEMVSPGDTIVE